MARSYRMKTPWKVDLVGLNFGPLTVLAYEETRNRATYWRCVCECGGQVTARADHLMRRARSGCPLCRHDRQSAIMTRHGACADRGMARLYGIWLGMRNRCRNPKINGYKYWGGKGIKVCEQWQVYEPFRDWALANGYAANLTIDRVKSDLNYEPDNCEWVTAEENSRRRWHSVSQVVA